MFNLPLFIALVSLSALLFFVVDLKFRRWAEARRERAVSLYKMILTTGCNHRTPSKVIDFCERKLPKRYGLSSVESAVLLRCEQIRADIEVKFRVHLNAFGAVVGVDYQVTSIDINNRLRMHGTYEAKPSHMIQEV